MAADKPVLHDGKVEQVHEKFIRVKIDVGKSCSGCHTLHGCSVANQEIKIVELKRPKTSILPGDDVIVEFYSRYEWLNQFLKYLLPSLLLPLAFFLVFNFFDNYNLAGIVSLLIGATYYVLFYFVYARKISNALNYRLAGRKKTNI